MSFTTITITGGPFTRPDGHVASGTVTATLSERIENGTTIIDPTPIQGIVAAGVLKDASGVDPFTVVANDDPGTTPAGSTYAFVIRLDSAPVDTFTAVVPHAAMGGTVDISVLL